MNYLEIHSIPDTSDHLILEDLMRHGRELASRYQINMITLSHGYADNHFTKVSKQYGDTVVLSEIDLEIPNQRTTVIVGQSEKTTSLRMVNGLIRPDSGRPRFR